MPKKKSDAAVASEIEVKKTFPLLYQEKGSTSHMRWPPEIIYAITISYLCEWVEMFSSKMSHYK